LRILVALLERPGELVLREDLRKRLWPNDTVVEFEHSISAAINKVRQALGDSAESSRFIETLARRGYRWKASVEWARLPSDAKPASASADGGMIGKKVSHYRVLKIIGGGGMGLVYEAEDLSLGRRVALKFLPEEFLNERIALDRFRREARAASASDHPNICTIYEIGEHEGLPFIAMQLLRGQTLGERIEASSGVPYRLRELLGLAIQVTDGLEAAHRQGVIHRDIKPANIFITTRGEAKILDFGLAKLVSQGEHLETHAGEADDRRGYSGIDFSRAGVAMGTAAYMSPEQIRGESLDARTDLFSFGLVLYEMATGERAFTGDSLAELHAAILTGRPTPACELNPEVTPSLQAMLDRALEKNRDARYQTAGEISSDLRRLSESSRAPTTEVVAKSQTPPRTSPRKYVWKILFAGTLVLAVAGAVIRYYLHRHETSRLSDKDTIVLADFANSTGDPLFDDTLKQATTLALQQSPFLSTVSDEDVRSTLKLMSRPPNSTLTPDIARELCQREGSKAYVAGAIGTLGSEYVLGLKAIDCQNGETLAREQVTAASRDKVLDALSQAATKLRAELGESLLTIGKFDLPLNQTTASLEALKEYNLAMKLINQGPAAMLPHDLRAIQIDPNFAMAYVAAAEDYAEMNQPGRAAEYFTKAFQLRDHANELENLQIASMYYSQVTGELDKAEQTFQKLIASYPRVGQAYGNLAAVYEKRGQYEQALKATREAFRLLKAPSWEGYMARANQELSLQLFEEARQTLKTAQVRKFDTDGIHTMLYALALATGDSNGLHDQSAWFASQPEYQAEGMALDSGSEAYAGRLNRARNLTRKASDAALKIDDKEAAAVWWGDAAIGEALFDNATQARWAAIRALELAPESLDVDEEAALAFAMVGDRVRAQSLRQALDTRFPLNTEVQSLWLPTIDAQMELTGKKPAAAIIRLQATASMELGVGACLYPAFVRGEAYLAAGQGNAAAAEFQKILDHSGIVWSCETGALAHLGLARANALEVATEKGVAADAARARSLAAYREFFELWKDADPDIPILKQAKTEFAKLN
jgi:serine/threonine protein kinase/tetratricopeptide (TPR) repeat protein